MITVAVYLSLHPRIRSKVYLKTITNNDLCSGIGGRMDNSSSIPKLPPLNKGQSMSLPSIADYVDPRDVKMNELEKVGNKFIIY